MHSPTYKYFVSKLNEDLSKVSDSHDMQMNAWLFL